MTVGFRKFRVWGFGFRVWGLGLRVWGLGFRVWGLRFTCKRGLGFSCYYYYLFLHIAIVLIVLMIVLMNNIDNDYFQGPRIPRTRCSG